MNLSFTTRTVTANCKMFASAVALAAWIFVAASALAAAPRPVGPTSITVSELDQGLTVFAGNTDQQLAQQLSALELTERLSSARLSHMMSELPGEKSRQALLILADQSAFLNPPPSEILPNSTPDPSAAHEMLVQVVNYVNTTLRQLPNLIAIRRTTSFEDRPQEDVLEATGSISYSYLPLHLVSISSATITYRDRKEFIDESALHALQQGQRGSGLVTSGEFGAVLETVLGDALKGTITWARWERTEGAPRAVFHYAVPGDKSHYRAKFCCILDGFNNDGLPNMQMFDERTSYHGEITFDPTNGVIHRMTLQAEMPPGQLVSNAGMVVEYAPVEIGGKTYTCPRKSISILAAHTTQPSHGMQSRASYKGPVKTFLNDLQFQSYRRFGSEAHILTRGNEAPLR
jgi:hypothetical protein